VANIKITWTKSTIGYAKDQGATIKPLGLRRLNHSIVKEDNATVRGMVHKVRHLVKVEENAAE